MQAGANLDPQQPSLCVDAHKTAELLAPSGHCLQCLTFLCTRTIKQFQLRHQRECSSGIHAVMNALFTCVSVTGNHPPSRTMTINNHGRVDLAWFAQLNGKFWKMQA